MKACPDCLGEIPDGATFCRHCGERVAGKQCADCGTRNWVDAAVCRWCGYRFAQDRGLVAIEPFTVVARRLPTFLQRGRLLPQAVSLTQEKIVIATPGLFNLTRQEEEIPWAKVAGFDYKSGIFWDQVTIETRGQSASTIRCLAKADGGRLRQLLQKLEM